jgi:ABC-2 type transport system ATP-binding protein
VKYGATSDLEFKQVTKNYKDKLVLEELNFAVPKGKVVGFLGPNGAGKTTTMRALFGLTIVDGGEIYWKGQKVTDTARRKFGYLPEERGLYAEMTVFAQLNLFAKLHGLEKAEAIATIDYWLGIFGILDKKSDKTLSLSLGNQQRVQVIVALLHNPDLLILDEPFSGLDPIAAAALADVLTKQASSGKTVLFSSHQLDLVQHMCDHVVIINKGKVVAQGDLLDMQTSGEILFHMNASIVKTKGWFEHFKGVKVVSIHESDVQFVVKTEDQAQKILEAAVGHGPVNSFGRMKKSLSTIFKEAVDGVHV